VNEIFKASSFWCFNHVAAAWLDAIGGLAGLRGGCLRGVSTRRQHSAGQQITVLSVFALVLVRSFRSLASLGTWASAARLKTNLPPALWCVR